MVTNHESDVLQHIEEHGGFSEFWASEHHARAEAIEGLTNSGKIERVLGGQYPWCMYRVRYIDGGAMTPRPISEEPDTDDETEIDNSPQIC